MGMKRIGNPRFQQGVNSLGHKSWKVNPSLMTVDVEGLRAGLSEEDKPVSQLKKQEGPSEVRDFAYKVNTAGIRAFENTPESFFDEGVTKAVVGSWGILSGAGLVFIGAPFLGVPLAALTVAGLSSGYVRPRWREWRARRNAAKLHAGGPTRREYLREAREMVDRYPHWQEGESGSFRGQTTSESFGPRYVVSHRVNTKGIGEVSWTESDRRGEYDVEGSYLLYPGVHLRGIEFPHPIQAPGVNLRGAQLEGVIIKQDSNLDRADLRGASLRSSILRNVSLVGANLSTADLSGATLSDCDMDGVDLTDADVSHARLPLDLRGTNITREQFDSLAGMSEGGSGMAYRVREASFDEVVAAYGGDRDAVTVAMWAGDIEVRERASGRVVSGEYNPEKHYIPYWTLNEL